jgi:hypothetical protein
VQRPRGRHAGWIAVVIAVFVPAAIIGAYLDWILWADEGGILVTMAAVAILLVAGLLGLIGFLAKRGGIRRAAALVAAVGVGLVAGQVLGPSREPLIQQFDGTMTIRLSSPSSAVATGPVICTNVASGTDFAVTSDSNMRLETPDQPFVMVYANVGDRWRTRDDSPRKDGVRFEIAVTGALITDAGKPVTSPFVAAPSSTLESTFSNAGGSIRFSGLVPQDSPASAPAGDSFAGTVEWTCGPAR